MAATPKTVLELCPGDVIQDKYRIVREVGRGGMGVVHAADHLQLRQPVAIKLMLRGADSRSLERFQREARIVAQLKSQHVCKLLDVGTLADGSPFMVMEMLDGEDLTATVKRRGPLPPQEVVDYILQACEALAEAHVLGVVHRDIKPSNLFATRDLAGAPFIKVLDFGISKVQAAAGHTLTATGELLGSPRFMSPEQLQNNLDVDARTDVWALGAVLFELFTGRAAFKAETMAELIVLILQEEPEPDGAVGPALRNIIASCLEKDADDRYANVAELAMALGPLASERGRSYVSRICHIVSTTGWTPGSSASTPAPAKPATATFSPSAEVATPHSPASAVAMLSNATLSSGEMLTRAPMPAAPASTRLESPQPRRGGVVVATLAALVLVGGVVAAFTQLGARSESSEETRAEDDDTPSKKKSEKKKRTKENVQPTSEASVPAAPPAAPTKLTRREIVADSVKRNGGHDVFEAILLYGSGIAKVEMQDPKVSDRAQRHEFRGGVFHSTAPIRMDDTERKELPPKLFSLSDLRIEKVDDVVADALKRAGDPAAELFVVTVKRTRLHQSGFVDKYTHVIFDVYLRLPDRDMYLEYWGDGAFRCVKGPACPADP